MLPSNYVRIFDDFCGYNLLADLWNVDYWLGADSDAYITEEGDADDLNGTLTVSTGPSSNNYQQVDMQHTNQMRRAKQATAEFRFRLNSASSVELVIGFTVEDRFNTFGLHANSFNGDYRVYSRVSGVDVVNDSFPAPVSIDTDWHTVKVSCNGDGGTVSVYFDGELKGTIADADLPSGDITPNVWIQTKTDANKIVYVDYITTYQSRTAAVRYVGDVADSSVQCVGDGGNAVLLGMGTSGADAGHVLEIGADYATTDLGVPVGATECTAVVELDGEYYGAFDNPDVYIWNTGTSWSAQALNKLVIDFAKVDDILFAGTTETSGRSSVWRFDNPGWTDIGDSAWTNEANTGVRMTVHDGTLFAYYLSDNEVYEYSGVAGTWTSLGTPGGVTTGSLARQRSICSFKGDLYAVGGANDTIYRWDGGTTWTAVWTAADALQRPIVANGQIWALDRNTTTGEITVYATGDGVRWVAVDSFTPANNADVATGRAQGTGIAGITATDALIWEVR